MNAVFFALIATAFAVAAWRQVGWSPAGPGDIAPMQALTAGIVDSAAGAVTLALGLVGMTALFLGLVKVAEEGGLLRVIARAIRPLMVRAFPDVPADHPAMGAMILNMAANVVGLGNAATPFGIRAMQELDKLNPHKGVATDAMVLFLAINTASITLIPTSVIALRAASGSADPAGILPTTLFATVVATAVAVVAAKGLARFAPVRPLPPPAADSAAPPEAPPPAGDLSAAGDGYPLWITALVFAVVLAAIPLTIWAGSGLSPWIMPVLVMFFIGYGMVRGVRVYEAFVDGARDGFAIGVRIIPYLVAILVAIAMLRASGALDAAVGALAPLTAGLGLPAEALPMAFLRTLSGSGSYGVLAALFQDPATGPDTYVGWLTSTIYGSTETTFYVLAVYFGAVQVRRFRHALAAGLIADAAGVAASVAAVAWVFSG